MKFQAKNPSHARVSRAGSSFAFRGGRVARSHAMSPTLLTAAIALAFGCLPAAASATSPADATPAVSAAPVTKQPVVVAQADTVPPTSPNAPPPVTLAPVVVTGNPLRSTDVALPATVLTGDELVMRRGTTLGETLNGLPGVSSSYFGPNANRPIIRGLDGDRIQVLSNSGASIDASSLSFDHAVPIDPLVVEKVEVLRGPAALMYGGNAMGGVVNAIDNRIPRDPVQGVTGTAEARVGGADKEKGGSALLEAGNGKAALHVDVFGRETDDLRVPKYTPIENGTPLPETKRLRNSASRASGGSVGGSMTFDHGFLGASVDTYDSRYGTVAEEDVIIKMHREHAQVAGEIRDLGGAIRAIRGQFGRTEYKHDEVEGSGEIGTRFRSKGNDGRVEVEHAPIGPFKGVFGLQFETMDFSALGEEAFVPDTRTRKTGLFGLEETKWMFGTLSAGLRLEKAKVSSAGDAGADEPKFGDAVDRKFTLRSASISNVLPLNDQWQLSASLSSTERAPTYYELFANGVHVATAAFERGNPQLDTERGNNLDVALQWKQDHDLVRLGAYSSHYSSFIALDATGNDIGEVDEDGNPSSVPEYRFSSVRARIQGVELEGRHRMSGLPFQLDVSGKLDLTRATNLDTGEPLPRIAPLRATVGLDALQGPWSGRFEVAHEARQNRVPATDIPTDSHTFVNLSVARKFRIGPTEALWFLRLDNIGNELAYNAATIRTVRELAPLPGRSVKTGLRVMF